MDANVKFDQSESSDIDDEDLENGLDEAVAYPYKQSVVSSNRVESDESF